MSQPLHLTDHDFEPTDPPSPGDGEASVVSDSPIQLQLTDADFPRYWKSGSLKYQDFAPLTSGGTGVLQTCFDTNLNRVVVYKSLHEDLVGDETEVARFVREARVTAMIPHPGTVPLYELGRDRAGAPYFTMKKLEGVDLRHVLQRLSAQDRPTEAEFPLTRLIDILIRVGETLAYAHSRGVVHRDIKPANLHIGEFAEITVLDWGLAKVRGEAPPPGEEKLTGKAGIRLELTQPGRRFGTPLYMSPEQARGGETDERTDVYGVGIVLYEVLTGQPLVFGNDIAAVLEQILERPTPIPRQVAPRREIPDELEAICLRCLQKEPAHRYPTMLGLVDDLLAWRFDKPVAAAGPRRRDWLVRWLGG